MITLLLSIKKYIKDPNGLELLNIIQSSTTMLQYLVNDLLDLYQIKNGKFKKNEQSAEIRKELLIVQEIMKIQCEKKNIGLEFIFDPSVPEYLTLDI